MVSKVVAVGKEEEQESVSGNNAGAHPTRHEDPRE